MSQGKFRGESIEQVAKLVRAELSETFTLDYSL